MDVRDAMRRRRMVRSYDGRAVDPAVVEELVDLARRAPSAGNSQGLAFVVLEGADQTRRYWDASLAPERRPTFGLPGLLAAPVLIVVLTSPDVYVARYREEDKVDAGLRTEGAWPTPYWWVDAGCAIEHLLLGAVAHGLGACLFGVFAQEAAVRAALNVPEAWRFAGVVAVGHPSPDAAEVSGRSAGRPRRPLAEVLHRGGW